MIEADGAVLDFEEEGKERRREFKIIRFIV
jgi:hypothetical protein